MDRLMVAAGEREDQEHLQSRERLNSENKSSVYATTEDLASVLLALQAITGRQLTPNEEPFWMQRLSKYPKWKLSKLCDEYAGPFNDKVLAFMDALRQSPESYKALPEPDPTPRHLQIAKDFNVHIQKVMNFEGSREERIKWEWESYKELDKKYPHLNVLHQIKGEKRFQGL